MTKLFLIILGFLFSYSAFADQKNVYVQCDTVGPIYPGTIDFERNLTKWVPASQCRSVWQALRQELYIPSFSLSFNGVTYSNLKGRKIWGDFQESCNWTKADAEISFDIFESKTNRKLSIDTHAQAGMFPNQFNVIDNGQYCTVSIAP